MIYSLKGELLHKKDGFAVIESAGVGYKVHVSSDTAAQLRSGAEARLFCHHYVRENALELYGFVSEAQLGMFEHLISVSGIGPKSAMSVFEKASLAELERAIANEDPGVLTKISGIGTKTAEKIILELKDRIIPSSPQGASGAAPAGTEVFDALMSLGYSREQSRRAAREAAGETAEDILKSALKSLGSRTQA